MATKDYLNFRATSLKNEIPKVKKKLSNAKHHLECLDHEVDTLSQRVDTLVDAVDAFESATSKGYERIISKLNQKIEALEKLTISEKSVSTNEVLITKACTIAIFDSILGAITSWSTFGDQASDVEAASQTVIFPCVYERVMRGDDPAYLLDEIPASAELVVQRGREFVKWVRSECQTHITTEAAWEEFAPKIQEWWLNDGLPLLYGEADPDWEEDTPYTLDQIETWRNNPVDRVMAFPKIHDAMDLLQKHRSEVNSRINLQEFNRNVAETRLS